MPRKGRRAGREAAPQSPPDPDPACGGGDLRQTRSVRLSHPRTHSTASPSATGATGQGPTLGGPVAGWALSFGQEKLRRSPHLGCGLAAVAVESVEFLVELVVEFRVPFPGVHHLLGATGGQRRRTASGRHREPPPAPPSTLAPRIWPAAGPPAQGLALPRLPSSGLGLGLGGMVGKPHGSHRLGVLGSGSAMGLWLM